MRQWLVDAFATKPFRGNQAAIVEPLAAWPEDLQMQALAAENNVGATAFLLPSSGPAAFSLRWFTPSTEVPLCGHATLAAAHVLLAEMGVKTDNLDFETLSGRLSVRPAPNGYEMALPSIGSRRIATPPGLAQALGAEPAEVWIGNYLVALLKSVDAVRGLSPDHLRLRDVSQALGGLGNVGVAAPCGSGETVDVIDRFFAPGFGLPEDPATGSFHAMLMPILAQKLGVDHLTFHQAFPGRGADLSARLRGDQVLLCGAAVTIAEAQLRLAGWPMPGAAGGAGRSIGA
jgi:predicted PhzF superfamily epimerase YddE/YHI9